MKKQKKRTLITLYLQGLISIVAVVLLVMYFINNKYLPYVELAVAFDLLVMGYNNKVYYKRENVTLLYVFFALVIIVVAVLKLLGV